MSIFRELLWPCGYILLLIRSEYKKNISVAMHLGVNNYFLYGSFEYVVITPNKYRIWYYDCQGQGHIILLYTVLFISKLFISSLLLYTKTKYIYIVPTCISKNTWNSSLLFKFDLWIIFYSVKQIIIQLFN